MQIQIHLSAFVFWIIVTILVLAFILSIFLTFDEWIPFAFIGGLIVATALRPSLICSSKTCKHGDHEEHSESSKHEGNSHSGNNKGYGEHSKHRVASENCEDDTKFKIVYYGLIFVTLFAILAHVGIRMGKDFCVEPCRNNTCCGDKKIGSIF